jgi:hypothetical protein
MKRDWQVLVTVVGFVTNVMVQSRAYRKDGKVGKNRNAISCACHRMSLA